MKNSTAGKNAAIFVFAALLCLTNLSAAQAGVRLNTLGTYASGIYNQGASEIVAYDERSKRLFTVNGATSKIDVLSLANPSAPVLLFSIDLAPYGRQANSVDVRGGIIAAAVEAQVKTDNGKVVFFNANGNFLNQVTVGALPDMLVFTPDGTRVLVANEGEPNNDYTVDPEGSVSIVDLSSGVGAAQVVTADFKSFNKTGVDPGVRIFGPNASVAQDLEPEYIAVAPDSRTAFVTLQENNALGVLDLQTNRFTRVLSLGYKNHNRIGNGLDASDRDNANLIRNWEVLGMYQPDAIAAFEAGRETFLITANEGDAREYTGTPGFTEEARVASLNLDPTAFPLSTFLKNNANLGRLNVTRATGDADGDGDFDALYVFGARSFSIWTTAGEQIYDSGDEMEKITSRFYPAFFNAGNSNNTRDDRSDNKGPEPEAVTVGEIGGRKYAFIGLERAGGVMVYDVSNPFLPEFVQYVNNRNFSAATNTAAAGDLGPEGLLFIPPSKSPTGAPLLVAANEISGTTTVYEIVESK